MHENSRLLFNAYARKHFAPGQRILEIGPDEFPSTYQKQVDDLPNLVWDTLDLFPSDELTYPSSDPYHFPIEDGAYDIVLCGQVIEHVRKIWVWIRELQRVCRPGGTVVIIGPVNWPYHAVPVDCWRIYPEGMRALLEDTDLEIEVCTFGALEKSGRKRRAPERASDAHAAMVPPSTRRLLRLAVPSPEVRRWIRRRVRQLRRLTWPQEALDTVTIAKRR